MRTCLFLASLYQAAASAGTPPRRPPSPSSPFLINSPTSQPHRFRTPNHRYTRPTLPPFLRRADDGLERLTTRGFNTRAHSNISFASYHFCTTAPSRLITRCLRIRQETAKSSRSEETVFDPKLTVVTNRSQLMDVIRRRLRG
jgi:hypothetical protein